MSMTIAEERQFDHSSEPRKSLANPPEGHQARRSSGLAANLSRRLLAFWKVRVVEGIFMRRQIDRFYLLMGGHIYFETLSAAVQFDLFGLLKRHRRLTCGEIAEKLGIEEQPARILLLGCAALGLVVKSGQHYRNSLLARRYLVRDEPQSLVPIIEWQHHINYPALHRFHDALQANTNVGLEAFPGDEPTLYERLVHQPKLEQIFQDAMEAISVQANQMLVQFADLSQVRHLVDIGGGNGSNVIQLATRHAHLRATVFDSPSVCEIARDNMAATPCGSRLGAIEGNCFQDAFPVDADCILFCHFLTIWSENENRQLLRKAYEALPSGGQVIIFNMMQSDKGIGPLSAAMGSPYFLTLATGRGMLYCWNEYESWLRDAGFSSVTRLRLPRDHGLIVGHKAT